MRVAIMGTGGLGGFFGAWLAADGVDVTFVARGAHLDAIRQHGLRVTSALGDRHIVPAAATDDTDAVGAVDYVLFCVKNYDLAYAGEHCRALLHEDTAVITVLNGVEAAARLDKVLGTGHAVAGLTFVPSNVVCPGVVAHLGTLRDLTFGEPGGGDSERLARFRDRCNAAGLEAAVDADIEVALWTKFGAWVANSAATTLSRQTVGVVRGDPDLSALFAAVLAEVVAVGRARGVPLAGDIEDTILTRFATLPPETRSSTLVDLDNGKRLELDAGVGAVVRMGNERGVPTPVCHTVYAALKPFAGGAP